ncbi:MAG: hypothetical protein QOJ55_364, partial [Solirubrobacteraceae bacterium]|nr:hypothetical protein [Solirubrobacteraceae bacterium]
ANGAVFEIGGEQIHVGLATMKFVRRMAETAGAGGEAAAE